MQKRKTTILLICPYPVGHAPSQRFRFEQYLDQLQSAGFKVVVKPFLSLKTWSILYQKGEYLQKLGGLLAGFLSRSGILFSMAEYEFVFIHREAAPLGPPVFEFVIAKLLRKKIIYDFDDSIWLPNTSEENKVAAWLKWHSKVNAICRWSYKVSCGNEYLCDFARQFNSNVVLNPTTIDTENLHHPANVDTTVEPDRITIGWTGTHSTLKYLEALVPVIQSLEKRLPGRFRFLVIADKNPHLSIQSFQFIRWSKETEIEDLLKIDIGVMPLANDVWAKGKCGFKALQYMALNVPVIASSVGVNPTVIGDEAGYLCSTPETWIACLERLIADKNLRKEMGKKGRENVIGHYSVISNSLNFLSLFS